MSSRPSSRPEGESAHSACSNKALDLLARREHSRVELERKLLARSFEAPTVEAVLDELEQSGALHAERFLESFVRGRVARGQGPVRIRRDLAEHGIESGRSTELLRSGDYDWNELARAARAKRFGPGAPKDYKDRARQGRFLEYRGFEAAQIHRALDIREDSD
jgi:regulatory protein